VNPFCGREEQLGALLTHWQEVQAGAGGRAVVLLAETGLGKTRLVQEFYQRLVRRHQGHAGYWPASLGRVGDNLLLNPAPGDCNPAEGMPFLWWGVRLAHPTGRNQLTTGSLASHVEESLAHQLEPFHREQRRRQRLLQLAKVGGAIAADAVVDLVPFLGLAKKLGEVGLELKGIHDAWRQDRGSIDGATLTQKRRDSLVEQLLADLARLFEGPAGSTVPAVVVIDDAQFSDSDPGVTAFVRALLPAMTEGRWPLLLLVTHWEREYAEAVDGAGGSPVAHLLLERERTAPGAVFTLRLPPLPDLGPVVTSLLPGLPADQVMRLTERAGGNPQYLDEIVKLALDARSRGWFEGRDTGQALTPAGLDALLSRSVRLQDVVAERLAASPEAVQRGVALAGVQGSEFLLALVGTTLAGLGGGEDETQEAEVALMHGGGRLGFVMPLGEGRAAFSQRIYLQVAREFLPAFYDEAEVIEALSTSVIATLLGERELPLGEEDLPSFWRLVVDLFEQAEEAGRRRFAAYALHCLLGHLHRRGELEVAHQLALRQAALLATLPDDLLDGDLTWLRGANEALAAVGDTLARRPLMLRLVELTGATFDDDVNVWSAAMYAQALMDLAELREEAGESVLQSAALMTAKDVLASVAEEEADAALLDASLRLHLAYAEVLVEQGRLEEGAALLDSALELASLLVTVEDAPWRRLELARARGRLASVAMLRGDTLTATQELLAVEGELRHELARREDLGLEIHLARTLDELAGVHVATGRLQDAEELLQESLELMRKHSGLSSGASRTLSNLADSLERLAEVKHLIGDVAQAWTLSAEALESRLKAASTSAAAADRWALGYSHLLAARVALAPELGGTTGAFQAGYDLLEDGLALIREEWSSVRSVSAAWRMLQGLKVAATYELRRDAPDKAHGLLSEAEAVMRMLAQEELPSLRRLIGEVEDLRAETLRALQAN